MRPITGIRRPTGTSKSRGYSGQEINKIVGLNFLRVFREARAVAADLKD